MGFFNFKNDSELPTGYNDEKSDFYVPSELRDDYKSASVDFGLLAPYIQERVKERAKIAYDESVEANRRPDGVDGARATQAQKRVIDAGPQAGDELYAEHAYRLQFAATTKAARDSEAARERIRQANRCRVCGVLDRPTERVVVRVTEASRANPLGLVATLPGGPVCADCTPVVASEYVASALADATIDNKGTTRRDAARLYLAGKDTAAR